MNPLDLMLSGMTGEKLLSHVRGRVPDLAVITITARQDLEKTGGSMKASLSDNLFTVTLELPLKK